MKPSPGGPAPSGPPVRWGRDRESGTREDADVDETILFVGVGRMGGLMAERLLAAGARLAVADLSEEALAPFRARGVPAATTGAD
ncbi:NAD(P)-binding domain-containing protein, partial [Oharaeibacter diazotrophicus]|uniref:NAD(P)-binding domain-containing protein n=1 Tax=Oharaeibacter diazotrophicus TaxID=1920512 RepID=UPI003CCEF41C